MFEAAVPFSVPFWAIIRGKYKEYAKFVLVGSLIGCFFSWFWTGCHFGTANRYV